MWRKQPHPDGHDSRAVANRLIEMADERGISLTILHLVKLVYFAHGWHLGLFHKPLIRHTVQAWRYGPVIPEVYSAFRPKPPEPARAPVKKQRGYKEEFTEDETMVLRRVLEKYSAMPFDTLTHLTHRPGSPWDQVRQYGYYATIPNEVMEKYFGDRIRETRANIEREKTARREHGEQR